jgi:hypothetical protein
METHRNAFNKLMEAVTGMAASDRPLRYRLARAVEHYMSVVSAELPDDGTRARYDSLIEDLTVRADAHTGKVEATLSAASDDEVRQFAKRFCALFESLAYTITRRVTRPDRPSTAMVKRRATWWARITTPRGRRFIDLGTRDRGTAVRRLETLVARAR